MAGNSSEIRMAITATTTSNSTNVKALRRMPSCYQREGVLRAVAPVCVPLLVGSLVRAGIADGQPALVRTGRPQRHLAHKNVQG